MSLLVCFLVLTGCGGNEASDGEQSSASTDTVVDAEVSTQGDDATTTTTAVTSSSTSALSITTASTAPSTSTSTTAASTPCASASIAGDLGAASSVVNEACEAGWAIVDLCDDEPCGDSWVLARHQSGRWSVVTGFPTGDCRGDFATQGAPDRVLDVVNWPPCERASAPSTTTPAGGSVDVYSILDTFIAAWDAGDWATMATVADSAVVGQAQAAAVPGGSVLPGPDRGRCFFGFPNTTCEVAYGTQATSALYQLTVTDRIITMEPVG